MNTQAGVSENRRLYLRLTVKVLVSVALLSGAYVLLAALISGDDDEDALPIQRLSIASIAPGESEVFTWVGRPVLVVRRTAAQLRALAASDEALLDAESMRSEQPEAARNRYRSIEPEWFVAIGIGTDYGCPVSRLPATNTPFRGRAWPGGFIDECRGSRYDLAGRVYADQFADRNLVIPRYSLIDGDTLRLGR